MDTKLKRVKTAGKVTERLVALPGTLDDLKAWGSIIRGAGTVLSLPAFLTGLARWPMDNLPTWLIGTAVTVAFMVSWVRYLIRAERERATKETLQWLERRTRRIGESTPDELTLRDKLPDKGRWTVPPEGWVLLGDGKKIIEAGALEMLEAFRRQRPGDFRVSKAGPAQVRRDALLKWLAR